MPYLVLVGDNRDDEQQHTRLNRIARKLLDQTLDTFFGDQNDLVIGVNSMRGVRNGTYAKARLVPLACNHFGYYGDPEAQAAIKGWNPEQEDA